MGTSADVDGAHAPDRHRMTHRAYRPVTSHRAAPGRAHRYVTYQSVRRVATRRLRHTYGSRVATPWPEFSRLAARHISPRRSSLSVAARRGRTHFRGGRHPPRPAEHTRLRSDPRRSSRRLASRLQERLSMAGVFLHGRSAHPPRRLERRQGAMGSVALTSSSRARRLACLTGDAHYSAEVDD